MSLEFEHFIGLNTIQQGALFHPNGQNYIFSSGAKVVVGDLMDPHRQDFLRSHDDVVTALALSPRTGSLIASGQSGVHSDICVWDFATKQRLYKLEEHDNMIQYLAFSDDEKILASIGNSDDGNLIIWDMSNGCIISSARIAQGTNFIVFNGFMRDIKRRDTSHYQLLSAGADGIMVWDLDPYSGDLIGSRMVADARATLNRIYTSLCFSDDKEVMFGATTSGDYVIASMKAQRILKTTQATRMTLHTIVTHHDRVLIGCGDKTIKIYAANGDYLNQIVLDGAVIGLSLSADKLEVLATTAFGSVARINLATCQYILISESHTNAITKVVFDQGSLERFATISSDGVVKVWDLEDYAVISTSFARKEQDPNSIPLSLQFTNILFTGWSDGRVVAFSAETGESLWYLDNAHPGGVTALALSHNKRFILTGGPQGEVRLWELRTRELISHLKEHKQKITSLGLFGDDTVALSASRDRCILRWDLRNEKRVHCHMQRMGGINDFVLTGNDRYIISVGQDRKIVLWDNTQNDFLFHCSLNEELDEGYALAITRDGRYVLTGGSEGTLRIWQVELPHGLRLISSKHAHSKAITSVAFSKNDKQAVSVGEDGSIFIWWFYPEN